MRTRERGPPSALAEIFRHACLQSQFHQISPFSGQYRLKWGYRGDPPKIFFIGFLPMQNSKTVTQILLGETAHFSFCPPQIACFRGVGGFPEIIFSLDSSYFCYLGVHAKFQNCSTNPSGRNGPFWLLSAQNRLF